MTKRLRAAAAVAAIATASLMMASPTAQAAPAETITADQVGGAAPAACDIGALTDVVDGTANVYGGGWITPSCYDGDWAVTVTLYRNGSPVAARVTTCRMADACSGSVTVTDTSAGSQAWQAFVRIQGPVNGTRWGNVLYH